MARKQLDAFKSHMAGRRDKRRVPEPKQHDREATDLPRGVIAAPALVPCPSGDGSMLRVTRNIRGDTLGALWARRQIEFHQYEAGREWQRHWDASAIGGLKAADTTIEPVDGGGGIPDTLTDRVLRAVKALARADRDLGLEGRYLLVDVLGKGLSIEQAAGARGSTSVREREFWGRRFRECLDTVAVAYNLAAPALTRRANQSK